MLPNTKKETQDENNKDNKEDSTTRKHKEHQQAYKTTRDNEFEVLLERLNRENLAKKPKIKIRSFY